MNKEISINYQSVKVKGYEKDTILILKRPRETVSSSFVISENGETLTQKC